MRRVELSDMDHGCLVDMLRYRKAQAIRVIYHKDTKTPERRMQRAVADDLQQLIDKLNEAETF